MKKYLPIVFLLVGIVAVVGVYFLVVKKPSEEIVEEETQLVDIPLNERPITTLTPTADGHWLLLSITKLNPSIEKYDSTSLDYELLYELPDGRTQGVPGTISLTKDIEVEKELLLGSESSGKFRYDEGVETGSLTIRLRNDKGKLVSKLSTDFHLQTEVVELTAVDSTFSYKLEDKLEDFFVTMKTIGIPGDPPDIPQEPHGIFSSSKDEVSGEVIYAGQAHYRWTGEEWETLDDSNSSDIGFFLAFSM